jgi:hypothetical protein
MLPDALDDSEVIGLLARNVPTRLLDISRTGCLLESRKRIDIGTVGELHLVVQQTTYVDDVRVTRCVLMEGSSAIYLVGVEFVPTHRKGERSIRRAIASVLQGVVAEESSFRQPKKSVAGNSMRSKGEAS